MVRMKKRQRKKLTTGILKKQASFQLGQCTDGYLNMNLSWTTMTRRSDSLLNAEIATHGLIALRMSPPL